MAWAGAIAGGPAMSCRDRTRLEAPYLTSCQATHPASSALLPTTKAAVRFDEESATVGLARKPFFHT